jgi:hypothetical protein
VAVPQCCQALGSEIGEVIRPVFEFEMKKLGSIFLKGGISDGLQSVSVY